MIQLRWLVSVPLLSVSLAAAAAPAAAPKDARGSFAVYCEAVCGPIELPGWEVVEKDLNLIKRDSICVLRRPG